jgi:hypothetical protein
MTKFHMTGTQRQSGEYRWTVKDEEGETFWLVGEPVGVPLKIIGTKGEDLQVGFDLTPGTTEDEAYALARAMNSRITHIVLF